MKVEISFSNSGSAVVENGNWQATPAVMLPAIKAVASRVMEAPDIEDIDYAQAVMVAQELNGEVMTPPPKSTAVPGRVY